MSWTRPPQITGGVGIGGGVTYIHRASAHSTLVALACAGGTLGRLNTAVGWLTGLLTGWLSVQAYIPNQRLAVGESPPLRRAPIVGFIERDGAAHPPPPCPRALRHSRSLSVFDMSGQGQSPGVEGGEERDVC